MTEPRALSRDAAQWADTTLEALTNIDPGHFWQEFSDKEIYMWELYKSARNLDFSIHPDDCYEFMTTATIKELAFVLGRNPEAIPEHSYTTRSRYEVANPEQEVARLRKAFGDDSALAWVIWHNKYTYRQDSHKIDEPDIIIDHWARTFGLEFVAWTDRAGEIGLSYDEAQAYFGVHGQHSDNLTPEIMKNDLDPELINSLGAFTATI